MIDARGRPQIAIVSAAGCLPGAPDLSTYWANLRKAVDGSSDVPPAGRWTLAHESAYSPNVGEVDAVYSTRGYFLDSVPLDLADLQLPADWLATLDPTVHLAIHLTRTAWSRARVESVDPNRVSVMLGHIALPTDRVSELADEVLGPLFAAGVASRPRTPENRYVAGWPALIAARALGLGGPAFTLDAACASSLYAIKLACDALQEHRADAVIAGGLSRPDCLYTQMGFAQLRALSPSGRCSPFDAAADGLVVGEGGGAVVLKRLSDAVAADDHILGVIAGAALSNDREGNLLAPASEGQLRALRPAYDNARWLPSDVDLIECHATGTPVGDATEFYSLRQLWRGTHGRCVLGSAKANVGHLLTGAGAAGLLKVLLAIEHRTHPPTPNFHQPGPGIDLGGSPFRVLQAAEEWREPKDRPRRAAIDGFGFGGINAHLLVEEYRGPQSHSVSVPAVPRPMRIAVVGLGTRTVESGGEIELPLGRFAVPPRELEAMLPQQALVLLAAADAIDDAGPEALTDPEKTGAYIGISLDPNTTNFHFRWTQPTELRDDVGPPLTADRTMGALASIAASRIARAFKLGGPSITLSSEETSGAPALEAAARALARGEIRAAIVGGVDLASDVRTTACLAPGEKASNVAVAFLLERLDDAERAGRKIYALIDGMASGGDPARALGGCLSEGAIDDSQVGLCVANSGPSTNESLPQLLRGPSANRRVHCNARRRGYAGAANLLVAVADACRALHTQVLPAGERVEGFRGGLEQFWLHDRADGPRAAIVAASGFYDWAFVALTEAPAADLRSHNAAADLSEALFLFEADTHDALRAEVQRFADWVDADPTATVRELARSWWHHLRPRAGRPFASAIVAANRAQLSASLRGEAAEGYFAPTEPLGRDGLLAFIYPGSGNHYDGMGRELGRAFPFVLRRHQLENRRLRAQWRPELFWDGSGAAVDGRNALFGQVCFGALVSDLLSEFGVHPDLAIGNSLGTSASLFGLRAWTERDEMLARLERSSLFTDDLTGPMHAARAAWQLDADKEVEWLTAVVTASPEQVRAALPRFPRAYLLTINTPDECTIGGEHSQVAALAHSLGCTVIPLTGVTAAHCAVVRPVAEAYRELHRLPTVAPAGVRFLHQESLELFVPNKELAADAILGQAQNTVDFPAIIAAAYDAGARVFVEIGPGASCTRMVAQILGDRPHVVRSCSTARDEVGSFLRALAMLHAQRVPVDLTPLYGQPEPEAPEELGKVVCLPVRPAPFDPGVNSPVRSEPSGLFVATASARLAESRAHAEYLRFAAATDRGMRSLLEFQSQCLSGLVETPTTQSDLFMDRDACLAFAVGGVGPVLGAAYAEIDSFPTRVRLPDVPLMLVDRIVSVEGEPLSLTHGRVVTEHDILVDDWYLDHDRIPVCIAVESGQADLFLSGYLGIDLHTRGLAVYRLLDAVVTFHRELPGPGHVIRYDIHIDRFFRQGDTHLFRFRFEATVDGEPLLTMKDGCAGFFTEKELAGGKGIVHTELDRRPIPGVRPESWRPFAPIDGVESYDDAQLDALRRGDLAGCFGERFGKLSLRDPLRLPDGRMRLVHRITHLDPSGGRFGLGLIRGEAEVRPDDWYLTCHFVDDQVMPGTLMYECCLHTLRVYLMRLGWVGEREDVAWQPIPGVAGRLKCRGQVIASTRKVEYEVSVKEIGYRPEPYAIADVLMYADGKPIVEIVGMSVRLTGTDEGHLAELWANAGIAKQQTAAVCRHALFDTDRILAFAVGKPSEAFGERYRVFDSDRVIARLPGPPYQFLDRIVAVEGEPWVMKAGLVVDAEYDVPADAWYFDANRRPMMPFAVLLEIALQPCGWLAAYMGSALTSDVDLSFRNLGGKAVQHQVVTPAIGTLSTRVKATRVSSSGGMIIQHYDFAVRDECGRPVYDGTTYFGFFSKAALANQVGIREAKPHFETNGGERFAYSQSPPFPDPRLSMIDAVVQFAPTGGPQQLGFIQGEKAVRPEEWFFQAHFHQDPVMPGSLGLEAFLQLLYTAADRRWGAGPWQTTALGVAHEWVYRGQVVPTDQKVTVQAELTKIDDANRLMHANGYLSVDGRVIYRMLDFTLQG